MPDRSAGLQALRWSDLRVLLAVGRSGVLSAAARRLAVDETTVARRIARAEAALGVRLFHRADGRWHPTEAGAAALARAERVELEVEGLECEVAGIGAAAAGTVRVTSVPVVVNRVLAPAVPGLLAAHPQLRLELVPEPRDLSLTRRDADIALRLSRPRREARVRARRIGALAYAAYGAAAGGGAGWILYDEGMAGLPQAAWLAERAGADGAAATAVHDAETLVALIAAGVGRSLLPCAVGDAAPGLARIGPPVLERELWLLLHPDLAPLARIRAAVDWIERACRGVAAPGSDPSPTGASHDNFFDFEGTI